MSGSQHKFSAVSDPHGHQPIVAAGAAVENARCVLLLIHGRGATAQSMLPIYEAMGLAEVAVLAPQAAGVNRVLLSATNSTGEAHQVLTIRGQRQPGIVSGPPPVATVGRHYQFVFRCFGYPVPSLHESGTLPKGIAFVTKGKGLAVLTGVPAARSEGSYRIRVRASNSLSDVTAHYVFVVMP